VVADGVADTAGDHGGPAKAGGKLEDVDEKELLDAF